VCGGGGVVAAWVVVLPVAAAAVAVRGSRRGTRGGTGRCLWVMLALLLSHSVCTPSTPGLSAPPSRGSSSHQQQTQSRAEAAAVALLLPEHHHHRRHKHPPPRRRAQPHSRTPLGCRAWAARQRTTGSLAAPPRPRSPGCGGAMETPRRERFARGENRGNARTDSTD
jgi:hypothetical protein